MIGNFIAVLFLARDIAHREHLRVTGPGSDARHRALGAFYEEIIDQADELAEVVQGRDVLNGGAGVIDIPRLDNAFPGEILPSIMKQAKWLEDNRYKAVPKEDTVIQNLIDELVKTYLRTIYKLNNLQ